MLNFFRGTSDPVETKIHRTIKKLWKAIGREPHNVDLLEEKILSSEGILFYENINRDSVEYSQILNEMQTTNLETIEKHLDSLFKRVKNLLYWKTKWSFLPIRNNLSLFLEENNELQYSNLISLQKEVFIDL